MIEEPDRDARKGLYALPSGSPPARKSGTQGEASSFNETTDGMGKGRGQLGELEVGQAKEPVSGSMSQRRATLGLTS